MDSIGKIGVIIPEISDYLDYQMVDGIHKQAKELGYDIIIITAVFNAVPEYQYDNYIRGLENIYELIGMGKFDGIIFVADRFYNRPLADRIFELLKQTQIPSIVLGKTKDGIPNLYPEQRQQIKDMTNHLIKVHNYKKIYFMAGMEGNFESDERMQGYLDAMSEAGLYTDKSYIYYGGFWKFKPVEFAEDIAKNRVSMPEAVVCANDIMALSLCNALIERGIRVPEDVAITGYDGLLDTFLNETEITTICGHDYQFGTDAMCRLYEIMTGKKFENKIECQTVRYCKSCGCEPQSANDENEDSFKTYLRNNMVHSLERKYLIASNYIYSMDNAHTLDELMLKVDRFTHLIHYWKRMDICLCEDWKFNFENPAQFRQHGFSDKMFIALSKIYEAQTKTGDYFDTSDLFPSLNEPHKPLLAVLTSLHGENQIFGYMSMIFDNVADLSLDGYYISWCDAVCNGLQSLQRNLYIDYAKQQTEILSAHDIMTGLYNKRGLMEELPKFLEQNRKRNKNSTLVIFASSDEYKKGIDDAIIISNCIRNSASDTEIQARLGERVFAVLMVSEPEENHKQKADERIISLEVQLNEMKVGMPSPHTNSIVVSSMEIDGNSIGDISKFIEQEADSLEEKVKAESIVILDYREQLNNLRREIYVSPQLDWSIDTITKTVGISRSHLQRMYKSQFAVSCIDDIINARLEKAKQLLLYTNMRVHDVALQSGYTNTSHFMRQFKKKYGITASEFRKK